MTTNQTIYVNCRIGFVGNVLTYTMLTAENAWQLAASGISIYIE